MSEKSRNFSQEKHRPAAEAENAPDTQEKHIAFNTQLLFMLFIFSFLLCCSVFSFTEKAYAVGIGFLVFCLVPIFCFLIAPMYIVFTAQEITIVYLWGIKERIEWRQVRNITEYGSWFQRYGGLPEYSIAYPRKEKYPFFVNGGIPKTRKTKKMIKRFYKTKYKERFHVKRKKA